jgi:hypothetical protein
MLEGGWSVYPYLDKEFSNNWSSGNVIDTILLSFGIYVVFLISAKSKLMPNLIFYGLVLALYLVNTHLNFLIERNLIDSKEREKLELYSKIIFLFAIIVLIYGFIEYIIYQKGEYGKKFRWDLFILGTSKCKHIKD